MAETTRQSCKHCQYCTQYGQIGRKRYRCDHPGVNEVKDKYGYRIFPFIGFGDTSAESPLVLKTRKRWCPMEVKHD